MVKKGQIILVKFEDSGELELLKFISCDEEHMVGIILATQLSEKDPAYKEPGKIETYGPYFLEEPSTRLIEPEDVETCKLLYFT